MKQVHTKMRNNNNKKALALLIASAFLTGTVAVQAAEIVNEIYLDSYVIHHSNPTYQKNNKRSVVEFRIEPRANLSYDTGINRLYLNSALAVYRNSNEDVFLDRENPNILLGWERTLQNGLFSLEANYLEELSLTEQLETAGTATVGTGNTFNVQTKTKGLQAHLEHNFNETLSTEATLSYRDVNYSGAAPTVGGGPIFGGGVLQDFDVWELNNRILYLMSPVLSAYTLLGHQKYDQDGFIGETKVSRFGVGAIYEPFEGMEVDGTVGYYKSSGSVSEKGFMMLAVGTYERERTTYNFELAKDLVPTGNNVQEVDRFQLGADYLLSEVQTIGGTVKYNKSHGQVAGINDVKFTEFGVTYTHEFENWTVRAFATHAQLDNGDTNDNNRIGVSFTYGPLSF